MKAYGSLRSVDNYVNWSWILRLLGLAVLFFGLPLLASAQEATIVGTVTDPSGAVVPNAAITITSTDTGLVTHVVTDASGDYVAPSLHIGEYTVQATAPSFKAAKQNSVVLEVGARRRVDFQLQVGAATQEVTVHANTIAVQSDSNEISTLITGKQIEAIQEGGQSLYNLVSMVPGASANNADVQVPTPMGGDDTISFNGQRIAHQLFMIDGGEAADRGGSGAIVMPSEQALSQLRVLTSNYSAQYGTESGATTTMVIKSGTRQLHADAWWFGRNNAFDARNYFNPAPQKVTEYRYNLWGFNVGGPVQFHHTSNPKTFFFYNMEWRRQILGALIQQSVPFADSYSNLANGANLGDAVAFNGGTLLNKGYSSLQAPYACQVSNAVIAEFAAAGQALSGCTGSAPNPALIQPFVYNGQQNVINPALINPNAAALLKAGIFPAETLGDQFVGGPNAPTSVKEEIVRVDHTFNSRYSIFGSWISEQISQTDVPTRWSGANLPTDSDTFGNPSYQAVVHLTDAISPTVLNEVAFNYDGNRINMDPSGIWNIKSAPGFTQNRLFTGTVNADVLPIVSLQGKTGASFNNNWGAWDNVANDYNIIDDVSWSKGPHQFKFGFGWANFRKLQPLQDSPEGNFGFNGNFTGYDFADYLLGLSSGYSEAALEDSRQWNSVTWDVYGEDNWRVNSRLTLNLGLRWEGMPHTDEINNQMSNFYFNLWDAAGAAAAFAPGSGIGFANSNGTQICSGAGIPNATCTGANPFLATGPNPALNGLLSYDNGLKQSGSMVKNHWDTFAPRVGFAYDLTGRGKTILRAGFGMFYERIQGNDMYQSGANNLFGGNPSLSNVSLSDPHVGIDQNNVTFNPATLPVTVNSITMLNSNDYKIPTSYQYSAGIQQQLSSQTVLSVAYVGNVGRNESEKTEFNLPPESMLPSFFTATGGYNNLANLYKPYLGYSSLLVAQNDARSNYNSLQVSLRSQFRNLTLQSAYTFARANDPTLNNGDGGDFDNVSNPYAGWRFDYGPAQDNRQNVFFTNFIYSLPFFHGASRLVSGTLGGWSVAGIVTMETGVPIDLGVTGQTICAAVPNCGIRPNLVGAISYPKTSATLTNGLKTLQWLNPASFAINDLPGENVATFGDLQHDGAWGPGRDNWNMSLFKTFAITERLNFQVRVDVFNLWNHTEMNGVSTTVGSPDFGKTNTASTPREFQFGAKLAF
ncbi:MAG: carboxypeptidase regulatory-like domain-containing protein [Candidatus Acidiferrales bacterium]